MHYDDVGGVLREIANSWYSEYLFLQEQTHLKKEEFLDLVWSVLWQLKLQFYFGNCKDFQGLKHIQKWCCHVNYQTAKIN